MNAARIDVAMTDAVAAALGVVPIRWPNMPVPNPAGPWARVTHLPATPTPAGIMGSPIRHIGILQVDLFALPKTGEQVVRPIAANLLSSMRRGTVLTNGPVRVLCTMAYAMAGYEDDGWYIYPIRVAYRADVVD